MSDLSLKQAFDLFIFDRETFCLDKTIENYQNTIRYFCSFMAEKRGSDADRILISSITLQDLKEYVVWLRNRPSNLNHPFKESGGKLAKRTIRNYTIDLKTFFHFLHTEKYLDNDISVGLKVIKSEKKTVIPLSAPEVRLVDDLFNTKTYLGCRNYCIVHLMLDAGLRSNEVCTLRIQDVNFDNKLIRVFGKGSKERVVPMSRNLRKYMYEYVYLHRKAVGTDYFFAKDNIPLTDDALKSMFARIRKRTGIDRIKPHLLRHTFATCFILDGGSVEMLRILMGHESITTTQVYMHIASVYEFNENPYELDPIFFNTYRKRTRR